MIAVVERLLALLALLAVGISLGGLVVLLRGRVPGWLAAQVALPLAAAIAVVATAGSLFASEVAGYPPCVLCWYQRGAMYPLALLLTLAAARSAAGVWRLGVPLAVIGAALSIWHIGVERLPGAPDGACDPEAPCSVLWINEFGFLTLPTMALIGFVAIVVLLLSARAGTAAPSSPTARPGRWPAHDRPAHDSSPDDRPAEDLSPPANRAEVTDERNTR
jgi:disulfide bond formation protein DsbB